MDNVDNVELYLKGRFFAKNYPQKMCLPKGSSFVDNVDNLYRTRSSAMFTTSPAPMVINISPGEIFFKTNFSISSKEGK